MGSAGIVPGSYNDPMVASLDVCIRGAGIVGRTLALLLAADRLRVGLVEAAEPAGAAPDVRAYAINAASRELLQRVRAWPDQAATPVHAMQVQGDAGGELRFEAAPGGADPARADGTPQAPLAWIVEATALLQALDQALHYQPQVQRLPAPQAAALTVVCEGKASASRAEFGVEGGGRPYAQPAIAARLHADHPHDHVARQWFHPGEILALLPMGGAPAESGEPQGRALALVWSVPPARAEALMALPAADFEEQLSAATGHALGRLSLDPEQPQRARWPLQLAKARQWTGPGWALAGDAAHTVHPLAGQGLNLGLADVQELADVLRAREYWRPLGDLRLLRRYERARKGDVAAMQWTTDGLQALFSQSAPAVGWLRNWGMRGFERLEPLKRWAARQAAGGA